MEPVPTPIKLKPCPFCSGKGFLYYNREYGKYFAGCINELGDCKVATSTHGHDDAETAADTWNRRGKIILSH